MESAIPLNDEQTEAAAGGYNATPINPYERNHFRKSLERIASPTNWMII